jgi:hypothetical protein
VMAEMIDHPGQWTMKVAEGRQTGGGAGRVPNTMSRDELHNDVVTLAQRYAGLALDGAEQSRLERYRHELYATPRYGDGHLADPAHAADLADLARRALDRLNACAPPGRRFVLPDALYCVEA